MPPFVFQVLYMIIHPQFDPVALQLGPLAIRWYALSYIVGFVLFMWLGRRRIKKGGTPFTNEMLDDFLTWGVLGLFLVGGMWPRRAARFRAVLPAGILFVAPGRHY